MEIRMARQRASKKWELFPGRNKFYCDGYLMTAPNTSIFYLTIFLITGTSGLFFAFDCPFLADRITIGIPIIGGVLYTFTMLSLLRTSFSDPGILPRASADEAAYIEKQIEVPNGLNSPTYRPPPRTKEVFVRGQTVKLKYCFTCKIFRPPRASHCSLCDNCVDRFDHHCPWVGNCVGRRNYRFFYMFIVSLAFLAVFIFACALTHLVLLQTETKDFLDVIRRSPFSVIVSAICFLSVWSVIGLAGFHTYLTSSDQTTNEDIKGSFSTKSGQASVNPYSRGNICVNCFYILCGPLQPSLIDRRGPVTDDFRQQLQAQDKIGIPQTPMVVQPIGSMDPLKAYNNAEQLENPSSTNATATGLHGVYRQRSYDNLQNDKSSSSVSHLVENEISLASALPTTPTTAVATDRRLKLSQSSVNDIQISPLDLNEIIICMSNASEMKKSNYNSLLMSDKRSSSIDNGGIGTPSSSNQSNIADISSISQNVYSNIPPSSPSVPSILKNAAADHVYSNIDETITGMGSSYMTDNIDLDLDDPLLTSSFSNKEKPNTNQIIYNTSVSSEMQQSSINNNNNNNVNKAISSFSSSSSTTGTQITSIELKNVLKNVVLQQQAPAMVVDASSPAILSPSSLRQTMIDTALDLDSLDGSSIENNSQVGLMSSKTALV